LSLSPSRRISAIIVYMTVAIGVIYGASQLIKPGNTEYVEITEYKGIRLSSINDFRENSIRGPQDVNTSDYKLEITGLVETPLNYSYRNVLGNFTMHKKVVTLNCVEGWSAKVLWEGVRIIDLLDEAKPDDGAETVIFYAEDGYTTSLPLDYVTKNDLILAYKINEVVLPMENGFPFQLVAESKWGYKWCRWVTKLELSSDTDYEGYWESRGYSNSADLDESFWGN